MMKAATKKKNGSAPSRDTRRRLEQLAANTRCEANVLSVVHGVPMREVARSLGISAKDQQSRFAIGRGVKFENGLFAKDAERLREALVRENVLPAGAAGLLDLRLRTSGGPMQSLDASLASFTSLLDSLGHAAPSVSIVAGPAVPVPGAALLPDGIVALDVLVVAEREGHVELVVGEIKAYPDRAGYTDTSKLASARRQAGLYVAMLRRFVRERGLEQRVTVRDRGFLVLTRVGSGRPRVRADEDFAHQAEASERLLDELAALAARPALDEARRLTVIAGASTSYCEGCVSFCELAERCSGRAHDEGAPAILGDEAARLLGRVAVPRALQLLHGATPANDVEHDLERRLRSCAR